MSSERRLHPSSLLFAMASQIRQFAIPALFLFFTAGAGGWGWHVPLLFLLVPSTIGAIVRYVAFRYRYEPAEMVIRTGLVFRNERHVPYSRIQNLDAIQNVAHRLFDVVEVRVQTAGGQEPEATMSVLSRAEYEEMRARVFHERTAGIEEAAREARQPAGRVLLTLPAGELTLSGLIQNRGLLVIAPIFGLLWEAGRFDWVTDRIVGPDAAGGGVVRDFVSAVVGQGGWPLQRLALMALAFLALLVALRVLSVGWALVRLHGFTLSRTGEDLRSEFGLLTRVSATIPLRRVQLMTIREGPLHRLFGRASVRVDTAGGLGEEATATQREWLAPIIRRVELPALVAEVLEHVDLSTVEWRRVHPKAVRREAVRGLAGALFIALFVSLFSTMWGFGVFVLLAAWTAVDAPRSAARLGWSLAGEAVIFRSGWIWQQISIAKFAKIQAVSLRASPFDRRLRMARVLADTAGTRDPSAGIDIPYLPREVADDLYAFLSGKAARTVLRW